jgi:hypothetical protein
VSPSSLLTPGLATWAKLSATCAKMSPVKSEACGHMVFFHPRSDLEGATKEVGRDWHMT